MQFDLSVLYITGGEGKAKIIFAALCSRYARVCLGFEHGKTFTFLEARDGVTTSTSFRLPGTFRYGQLIYQWARVFWYIAGQSKSSPFDVGVLEGIQFTLIAPLLVRMGRIRRTVYYAMDWFPDSGMVQYLDKLCALHSDLTWNITSDVAKARADRWSITGSDKDGVMEPLYGPQSSRRAPEDNGSLMRCCYIGGIRRDVGLSLAVQAVSRLRREGLDVRLDIVGKVIDDGVDDELNRLATELDVGDAVSLHGFVDTEVMHTLLASSCCGLAVFTGGKANYSNWAIIGKVREYLENGVPVIISQASAQAEELTNRGAGVAVADSVEEMAGAFKLFCEFDNVREYGSNAMQLAKEKSDPKSLFCGIESIGEAAAAIENL